VGTGGGAPSASNGPGVGVGEAFGREVDFGFAARGVFRFCALVTKGCGNKKSTARVNSSTSVRDLLLLMQII